MKKNSNFRNLIIFTFLFFSLCFISMCYASLETTLTISGDLILNPDYVATSNGKYYASVQDAINSTLDNTKTSIVLLRDVNEEVFISSNKILNIDSNGFLLSSNKTTIVNEGILYLSGKYSSTGSSINNQDNYVIDNSGSLYLTDCIINATSGTSSFNANGINSNGISISIESSIINASNIGIVSNSSTETITIGKEGKMDETTLITGEKYAITKDNGVFVFNSGTLKGKIDLGYLGTPYLLSGYRIDETTSDGYFVSRIVETEYYTITYNPGNLGNGSVAIQTKTYNEDLTLLGAIYTRDGYLQSGWSKIDGGIKDYNLKEIYHENSEITLYPVWSVCSYTIGTDGDFNNINSALNVIPTSCKLTLVSDINVEAVNNISANQSITLDLNGYAISNFFNVSGKLIIDDSSSNKTGIINRKITTTGTADLIINNGTITSSTYNAISHDSTGELLVRNGTIIGNTNGINISLGTLTIGSNDSIVNINTPTITGLSQNGINVMNDDVIINFYDGVISGSKGDYQAINGIIDNFSEGYKVVTTVINEIETVILEEIPVLYLYNNGDSCTSLTGNWLINSLSAANNTGSGSIGASNITLVNNSTSGYSYARRANYITSNKINTTGYNYLNVEWSSNPYGINNRLYLGLYSSKTTYDTSYVYATYDYTSTTDVKQIKKINISSYQGSYYIGGFLWKPKDSSVKYSGKIYRIWLSNE